MNPLTALSPTIAGEVHAQFRAKLSRWQAVAAPPLAADATPAEMVTHVTALTLLELRLERIGWCDLAAHTRQLRDAIAQRALRTLSRRRAD